MYSQNMQFIFQEEMEKEAEMQSEPFVIFVFLFFLHDAYDLVNIILIKIFLLMLFVLWGPQKLLHGVFLLRIMSRLLIISSNYKIV